MADGRLMPHQGIVTLPLTLADGFVVEHPVVLADIDVPLILGFDFCKGIRVSWTLLEGHCL